MTSQLSDYIKPKLQSSFVGQFMPTFKVCSPDYSQFDNLIIT